MKLTLNDRFKHVFARDPDHIRPEERLLSGGMAGAVAQVRRDEGGMGGQWHR